LLFILIDHNMILGYNYSKQKKAVAANKCTSSDGCFDGQGGAPEQYRQHHPMRHVQGYSGSLWTPALGDYLLRIAPAAARATSIQTTINKIHLQSWPFQWPW
jgi:hypothetical protein